jgi:hypothetical protein
LVAGVNGYLTQRGQAGRVVNRREISAHFAEIYGASVSKETISRITDKVIEEMNDWAARPLDSTYAAVFIDAIVVKVRDGQVANRPFYAAIGVTLAGERDILGLCSGPAPAVRARSSGWPCSPTCATAASATRSSWSATDSRACPRSCPTSGRRRSCRPALISSQ